MNADFTILPQVFLRAPFYSFLKYDLDRIPQVLKDAYFQNAIYLASPQFYNLLEKKSFEFESLSGKEKFTVFKYYNRTCFRPTPFGAFASFSLASWHPSGKTILQQTDKAILHLLPDNQLKINALTNAPFKDNTHFRINPTLYTAGKEIRFITSRISATGEFAYSLSVIEHEPFHRALLRFFKAKTVTLMALESWFQNYGGCSLSAARGHIKFFLDEQLIISNLTGSVFEGADETAIVNTNKRTTGFFSEKALHQVSSLKILSGKVTRHALPDSNTPNSQVFYAALETPTLTGGPDLSDMDKLKGAIRALHMLSPPVAVTDLDNFKAKFIARYDQQKVPLMEAIDPDLGISYANLASAAAIKYAMSGINVELPKPPAISQVWTPVHRLLAKRWLHNTDRGVYDPIIINDADLGDIDSAPGILPPGIPVLFRKSAEHLIIEQSGGVTPVSLISRFSAFSNDVATLCNDIIKLENAHNPGVVFADIGMYSNLHTDNINRRTASYAYEIPVNVFSSLPDEKQIPPAELLVSVAGGELILESSRLKQRIIPRLTSAFNFRRNNLAVFRFLCDLQFQGTKGSLFFDLEIYFPGLDFYPRVQFKDVIISPAKWKVSGDTLKEVKEISSLDSFYHDFCLLRSLHRWPRFVSVGDSDQLLIFDLADRTELPYLFLTLQHKKDITFTEYLHSDRSVKTTNSPLAAQFVAFLLNNKRVYKPLAGQPGLSGVRVERSFPPGSRCLYFKIYCAPAAANTVLADLISPFLDKNEGIVIRWFFIRYRDPEHHLRFRVFADEQQIGLLNAAFQKFRQKSGAAHLVSDLSIATYDRELERYGKTRMAHVEQVFEKGSQLILHNLINSDGQLAEADLAFVTAWKMAKVFFNNPNEMQLFFERAFAAFGKEFNQAKDVRVALDLVFRERKARFYKLVTSLNTDETYTGEFAGLEKQTQVVSNTLFDEHFNEKCRVLADLIHMQMNRNFAAEQRKQEMVNYYFLFKFMPQFKVMNKR